MSYSILKYGKEERRLTTFDKPGTHLITKVKQRSARLVLGWVTAQMTSIPGADRRCTRMLRPSTASEKIPRGVISSVCVKYCQTPQENFIWTSFFQVKSFYILVACPTIIYKPTADHSSMRRCAICHPDMKE
jgi:hypothetical protein